MIKTFFHGINKSKISLILFLIGLFSSFGQANLVDPILVQNTNIVPWVSSSGVSFDGSNNNASLFTTSHSLTLPLIEVSSFRDVSLEFTIQGSPTATAPSERKVVVSKSYDGISYSNSITYTALSNTYSTTFSISLGNIYEISESFSIKIAGFGTTTDKGVLISNVKLYGTKMALWALDPINDVNVWIDQVYPNSLIDCRILSSSSISELINGDPNNNSTSIVCKSILVSGNSILTIDAGKSLVVYNNYKIDEGSDIIVESNANFIQVNELGVNNVSDMTIKRNTSPLKRLDYVLWSSPVIGQNLQSFSPETFSNRFYTYNPDTDFYVPIDPIANDFEVGKAYLIRVPNNHPSDSAAILQQSFTGRPNNGYISLTVDPGKYYAIGNPYPSDISLDIFAEDNLLAGPFYFWRKTNNSANPSYATYMPGIGGVSNSNGTSNGPFDENGLIPSGICKPGQGFIVNTTSYDQENVIEELFFDNYLRMANNDTDDVFLRTGNLNKNRVWLNLNNDSGLFSQTLIAYAASSSLGLDSKDGLINSIPSTAAVLSSVINNQPNYVIQARGDFNDSDEVPLSLKAPVAGDYTISLADFDGAIFENVEQGIFLKDNYTNSITNLKEGAYTFATNIGDFLNRFEVLFQNTVLSNNDFNADAFVVYSQNDNNIVVNGANQVLSAIKIFDSRGRLLSESKNINVNEFTVNISASNELLLIQITNESGYVVTKKIIH